MIICVFSEFFVVVVFFLLALYLASQIGGFLKYVVIFTTPLSYKSDALNFQREQDLLIELPEDFLIMWSLNINIGLFFEADQCHNS